MENKAELAKASDVFDQFCSAQTLKSIVGNYRLLCDLLKVRPTHFPAFYPKLKAKLKSWKAQGLWTKFDKRANHKCYHKGRACSNLRVLVIGGGPCGLRCAIEAQLLGAKVVVVEKRDRISRNNVLHLWPFVIHDLKALGAKKFFGKFCAGAIDHISIRQLQCVLLKVALLCGVEFHESVSFEKLREPECEEGEEENGKGYGWRAHVSPADHPVSQYEFDFIVGADGRRNTLHGFGRKEFRGRLAIAITANFINRHSEAEARVEEISGVAYIFNQGFFKDLSAATGIDLENIVYYKDDTHYFVMTAKKQSLLRKGVILHDYSDTRRLLSSENVDREALFNYAREAADFSTNYKLPHLDFAVNHYGQPDVAMFDFTSMYAAENACRVIERKGHKLVMNLVGDSLLEPFWPTGSGCARGFLSSMDAAWMMRSWCSGKMTPLQAIAERESIYRLLGQTTPENISRDFNSYTLDPHHRYPNLNTKIVLPFQVRSYFDTDSRESVNTEALANEMEIPRKRKRRDSAVNPDTLLKWLQTQLALRDDVKVTDLTSSFCDGRALARIVQRYRPELVDDDVVMKMEAAERNQFVFDLCEQHLNIPPVMTGKEMVETNAPDLLTMTSYLSQIYWTLRGQVPCVKTKPYQETPTSKEPRTSILNKIGHRVIGTNRKRYSLEREKDGGDRKDSSLKRARKRDRVHHVRDSDAAQLLKYVKGLPVNQEKFSDRVKSLEDKLNRRNNGESHKHVEKKPKELIRAIGKIETDDWNVRLINNKLEEQLVAATSKNSEHVPKWSKDKFNDKFTAMEKKLLGSESTDTFIERFSKIDTELRMLGTKIREGSTLQVGMRGNNKVAAMAGALAKKLESTAPQNGTNQKPAKAESAGQVNNVAVLNMASSRAGSETCHFCHKRVYLMERMSAEMKFFHRGCFKCEFCGTLLRLGNYSYDRDLISGGKFLCAAHWGMTGLGKMKAKEKTDDLILSMMASSASEGERSSQKSDEEANVVELEVPVPPLDLVNVTPERVEYETAVMDLGSEDEALSEIDEDEFTDRNFGNSTADTSDDALSDFSSESDGEENGDAIEEMDKPLTVDETRQLVHNWKKRYSEAHYISQGGNEEREEEEPNGDIRLEVPQALLVGRQDEEDDSESDTEIGSDEEEEEEEDDCESESDTEIETDSEFDMDSKSPILYDIPTIVIEESKPDVGESRLPGRADGFKVTSFPLEALEDMKPVVDRPASNYRPSLVKPISYDQHLKKVFDTRYDNPMQRIENLLNSTQPRPGGPSPRDSDPASPRDSDPAKKAPAHRLDDRFKSFMDMISQNQKLLNPAPTPSPSMQAYLSGPVGTRSVVTSVSSVPSWSVTSSFPQALSNPMCLTTTAVPLVDEPKAPEATLNTQTPLEAGDDSTSLDPMADSPRDMTPMKSSEVLVTCDHVLREEETVKDEEAVNKIAESPNVESPEPLIPDINSVPNESTDPLNTCIVVGETTDPRDVSAERDNADLLNTTVDSDEAIDPLNTNVMLDSPDSRDASCHLLTEMEDDIDRWAGDADVLSTTDDIEAKFSGLEQKASQPTLRLCAALATFDEEQFSLDTEDVEGKFAALYSEGLSLSGQGNDSALLESVDEIDFMDVSDGEEGLESGREEIQELGYQRLDTKDKSTPSSPSCEALNPRLSPLQSPTKSSSDFSSSSGSSRSHPSSCYADRSDETVRDELDLKLIGSDGPDTPSSESEVFSTPCKPESTSQLTPDGMQSVYVTPSSRFTTPMVESKKPSDYVPFSRTQTPFSGIRDSIGIRKSAMKKPLPNLPFPDPITPLKSSPSDPSVTPSDYLRKRMEDREWQRNLVKEMVLSRIKSPEKRDRKSTPDPTSVIMTSETLSEPVVGVQLPSLRPEVPSSNSEPPSLQIPRDDVPSSTPFKTPNPHQWNYYKNMRTVEKEKARSRARLKSDEELGLSPPSGYTDLKEKLRSRTPVQILSEPSTPVKLAAPGLSQVLRNAKSNVDLSFSSVTHPLIEGDVPQPSNKITRQMYENLNVFTGRTDRPMSLDVGQLLGNSDFGDYSVCSSTSENNSSVASTSGDGTRRRDPSKKKSKDPARRRSLIQAISGLFNKSSDSSGGSVKDSRSPTPTLNSSQSDSGKKSSSKEKFIGIKFRSRYKDKELNGKGKSPDKENQPPGMEPTINGDVAPKSRYPSREDAGNSSGSDGEVSTNLTSNSHYYGSLDKKTRNARKVARQNEMKRLRIAQEIQRKLEEVEVKQRELERKGVLVERSLRETGQSLDESDKLTEWFSLVHEKSKLARQEQELLIKARELELEDRHGRLQQELRDIMHLEESKKTIEDVEREGEILKSILDVVSQRDALVTLIEEDRKRYKEEDQDLEAVMSSKGIYIPRETGV